MILNVQTGLSYTTIALAAAALPAVFDRDYTLSIGEDTHAGGTISGKNTNGFSLTISGSGATSIISATGNYTIDVSNITNLTLTNFTAFGNVGSAIRCTGCVNVVVDAVSFGGGTGNFVSFATGCSNIIVRNTDITTEASCVGLATVSNVKLENNIFRVTRVSAGNIDVINGYALSGTFEMYGNTLESTNARYGFNTGNACTLSGITIQRNTFKFCTSHQLNIYRDTATTTPFVIKDNLFLSNGTKNNIYGSKVALYLQNNTFVRTTGTSECVKCIAIPSWDGMKNNIFHSDGTTAPVVNLAFTDTNLVYADTIKSDYNLWYVTDTAVCNLIVGTFGNMANLGALQSNGSDSHSVGGPTLFTLGADNTPYWSIQSSSPAHNAADHTLTVDTKDIRGYFRQDQYTDIGCYDIDAGQLSKPANDGAQLFVGVIRRNDNRNETSLQLAISRAYSGDEDIYLDITKQDGLNSMWLSMFDLKNGRIMYVQPHASVTGDVLVKDDLTVKIKVGASLEGIRNIHFKNIIFDGSDRYGAPGLAALKLGLGDVYNLVFENCTFQNAQHAVYMYTGKDITFKNCVFKNFYDYGLYGTGVRGITVYNCTFDYGNHATVPENTETGEIIHFYASTDVKIIGCTVTGDALTNRNIRFQECTEIVVERCLIEKCGKGYAILIGNNAERYCKDVFIRNNVFHNNGTEIAVTGYTSLLNFQKVENVQILNNSFIDNSPYYVRLIYLNVNCRKVSYQNNYIQHSPQIEDVILTRLDLDRTVAGGTKGENPVTNNFYNLYGASPTTSILQIGGGGHSVYTAATVAEAQTKGDEVGSVFISSETLTQAIDENFIPIVANGASVNAAPNLDYLGMQKDSEEVSFGAIYTISSVYTPPIPTDYYVTTLTLYDNTDLGSTYPIVIPALDKLLSKATIFEPTDIHKLDIIQITLPANIIRVDNITTIDPDAESALRVGIIAGNRIDDFYNVYSVKNTSTNAIHLIEYSVYDAVADETKIVFAEAQPNTPITISWIKFLYTGIGYSINYASANRDIDYYFRGTIYRGVDTYEFIINPYLETIQPRPKINFRADNYVIYLGDSFTITDKSFEADAVQYTIAGGGLTNVINDRTFTLTPLNNTPITITAVATNSSNFSSSVTKESIVQILNIPTMPVVNFDVSDEVVHKNNTVKLLGTEDDRNNLQVTRFFTEDHIFNWNIYKSDTNELVSSHTGKNPTLNITGYAIGSYDVELIVVHPDNLDIGKTRKKKRILTIFPDITGATEHHITCDLDDSYTNENNALVSNVSYINGTTPLGALNSAVINPGDVVVLHGQARQIKIYNCVGTPEQPIMIIPACDNYEPFKILNTSWQGFDSHKNRHIIISGYPNSAGLKYGFHFMTDLDPRYYGKTPGNQLMKLADFTTDVSVCGVEFSDSKFDCISAKTEPDFDDPSSWRNDPTGGFVFNNLNIHHCWLRDSLGEGVYIGYYNANSLGTANNSLGVNSEVYAHIFKNFKLFRNEFLNNGFDAMQPGCQAEGLEIHDNIIINSGWRNIFGQNAAISANYAVGDIYNNDIDNIIALNLTPYKTRVFNNIINTIERTACDGIYIMNKLWPNPKWDFSVVPQVITEYNFNGVGSSIEIYNNVIRCGRNAITLNPEWNFPPATLKIVNNVMVLEDAVYASQIKDTIVNGWFVSYNLKHPITNLLIAGNYITKVSTISALKAADPDNGIYVITPASPLYSSGANLKQILGSGPFYDKAGYKTPDNESRYIIGAHDFDSLNWSRYESDVQYESVKYQIYSSSRGWLVGYASNPSNINQALAPDGGTNDVIASSIIILEIMIKQLPPSTRDSYSNGKLDIREDDNYVYISTTHNKWVKLAKVSM